MGDTGDIVIRGGGSVELSFDSAAYEKEPSDPRIRINKTRNMTRVLVSDEDGKVLYDSGTDEKGLKFEVRVSVR